MSSDLVQGSAEIVESINISSYLKRLRHYIYVKIKTRCTNRQCSQRISYVVCMVNSSTDNKELSRACIYVYICPSVHIYIYIYIRQSSENNPSGAYIAWMHRMLYLFLLQATRVIHGGTGGASPSTTNFLPANS